MIAADPWLSPEAKDLRDSREDVREFLRLIEI